MTFMRLSTSLLTSLRLRCAELTGTEGGELFGTFWRFLIDGGVNDGPWPPLLYNGVQRDSGPCEMKLKLPGNAEIISVMLLTSLDRYAVSY